MPKKSSATSWVGGANLVVYKDSKNKELAWKFVDYLTDPKTQAAWYQEVTDLPAVQAGWEDPVIKNDPNVAKFGEQLKDTKAPPAIPTWNKVADAINSNLEKMTTGGQDPQKTADAMQQQAERVGTGS